MAITDQISSLEERIRALEEFKERMDKSNTLDEVLVNIDKIQTLSRKVLKVPVIDDFTNALHNHSSTSTGGILSDGVWNNKPLILGTYYLWVDATGDLRIKSSAPANDTDGTVIGSQS